MSNALLKNQHERMSINTTPDGERLKVIRQERISTENFECVLESSKNQLKVINLNAFGLLIESNVEIKNTTVEGSLIVNNVNLGIYKFKLIRSSKNESTGYNTALEIIGEPISVDRITAIVESSELIATQNKYQELTKNIPDSFCRKVYEIKDWLESLQDKLNAIENEKNNSHDLTSYFDYENTVVQVIGNYLNYIMPIKNDDLTQYLKDLNSDSILQCFEFFRSKLSKLVYQAPFSDRVFNKPLGYAGDFEMMNIIYRSEPEGKTLFAKCLHDYWVKQPAAQAVRNRAIFMKSKIESIVSKTKGETHFLSVASGPAHEWQMLLRDQKYTDSKCMVELLDQDEHALKHAQKKMKEITLQHSNNFDFRYTNLAIKNIIARGLTRKYDLIYSAGLFDYFSDPVAEIAAKRLFDALKPGGQVIIGNFNVSNPNSTIMDLALDWHLIYRSKEQLIDLFQSTGGKIEIESEPLDINIFCKITKK